MIIAYYIIPILFLALRISEFVYYGNIDKSFFSKEENFLINLTFVISLAISGYFYKIQPEKVSKSQTILFYAGCVLIFVSILAGVYAYLIS